MMSRDERRALFQRLVADVASRPGVLPPATRRAIVDAAKGGAPPAGALGALVETIQRRAIEVTDEHVEAARREGNDDDALFEAIVASALGASSKRLDVAMRALGRGEAS